MLQWFRKQPTNSQTANNGGDLHIALTRKLIDFLSSQISNPKRATTVMSQISRFKELPPTYQEKELPSLYLKIEQYLVDEDPLQKFTKSQLRKTVKYRYEPLMELENFSLIFEQEKIQELMLSQSLLKNLVLRANTVVGDEYETEFNKISDWVFRIPEIADSPMPLGIETDVPTTNGQWILLLAKIAQRLYYRLEKVVGIEEAASVYEKSYRELAETYRPLETFYVVVQLLPDKLLDENKIGLLTGEQIRTVFLNKVSHLQRINDELSEKNGVLKDTQNELIVAQDTALESVKLFHSVLDTVEEGIVTADAEGKIILVNQQVLGMFGYSEEELVGQNIQCLMPEKYREQHQKGMKRYLETKESRAIGQRLILEGLRKDKTVFPIELQITQTQISELVFFTAAMNDISANVKHETQLKKTSEDLRRSEQRYRSLLDAMQDIIFSLSLDGNFTSLNPAFESSTDWTVDEWVGKPFTQIVHPDDSMLALKIFQQVLQGETPSISEIRIRTKSDNYMIGEFTFLPQIQNGRMTGTLGVARNVTRYRKAEEALRSQEDNYLKLLDASNQAVGIHQDGKLIYVNPSAASLLGAEAPEELIDKPLLDIVHPEYQKMVKARVVKLLKEGNDAPEVDEKFLDLSGEPLEVKVTASRIHLNNKAAVQFTFHQNSVEAPVEAALASSSSNDDIFEDLFTHSPDALMITASDGTIINANHAACIIYKKKRHDLIGQNFLQQVPHSLRDAVAQNIRLLIEEKIESCESINVTSENQQFSVKLWGRAVEYEGQENNLLIVRDISYLKQASEKSETAQEALQSAQNEAAVNQTQLQEVQKKYDALKVQFEDKQASTEALSQQVEALQNELSKTETEMQTLAEASDASEAMESEINTLKTQYEHMTAKLQSTQAKFENSQSKLYNTQLKLEEAQAKLKTAETSLEQTNGDMLSQQSSIGVLQAKLQNAQKQLEEVQENSGPSQEVVTSMQSDLDDLQNRLQTSESERETLLKRYEEAQEALENTQHELKDIQSGLQFSKAVAQKAQHKLEESQQRQSDIESEHASMKSEYDSLQNEKEELQVRYNEAIARIRRWQMEAQETEEKLTRTDAELAEMRVKYDEVVTALQQAQSEGSSEGGVVNADYEALSEKHQVAQTQLKEAQEALQVAQTQYLSSKAKIRNLDIKIKELGELIPICQCKKIRDDHEFWEHLQKFAADPANAEYITGRCPNCPAVDEAE